MRLFWQRGYSEVSLSDLLSELGIGRQSFYNAFGSKSKLFDAAIDRYVDRYQSQFLRLLEKKEGSHHDRLLQFLTAWERAAGSDDDYGCLLVNCLDDLTGLPTASQRRISSAVQRWEQTVARTIASAAEQGEINIRLTPKKLARILVATGNGLMLFARNRDHRRSAKGLLTQTYLALVDDVAN